jgi:hypothetical protein
MSGVGLAAIFIAAVIVPPTLLEVWAVRLGRGAQNRAIRALKIGIPVVFSGILLAVGGRVVQVVGEVQTLGVDRAGALAAGISEGANTWAFWWLVAAIFFCLTLATVSLTRRLRT